MSRKKELTEQKAGRMIVQSSSGRVKKRKERKNKRNYSTWRVMMKSKARKIEQAESYREITVQQR